MFKTINTLLLALVLVVCLCAPVSALESKEATKELAAPPSDEIVADTVYNGVRLANNSMITPFWAGTSYVSHGISIGAGGRSVASVSFNLNTSAYTVNLYVTVQFNGSQFQNYSPTWSDSGTGNLFFSQVYYVGRGTYRLKTVGYVHDQNGRYIETVTLYSTAKTY